MRRSVVSGTLTLVLIAPLPAQTDLRLAPDEYPVVDGSTSTQPLGALIAGRVTRTGFQWQQSSIFDPTRRLMLTTASYDESKKLVLDETPVERGKPAPVPLSNAAAPLLEKTRHSGTSQCYARLAAGHVDLVLAAREPTPDEREAVRRAGSEIVVHPIARDAFVFLRNVKNPVASLTIDQVRDIYSGKSTNWKDVGGVDRPVVAYQREPTSGSQVEMEQLVMRGRPMLDGPDIQLAAAMFGPFNAIRHNPAGIGYSYHYYERFMAAVPEVATLAINGVAPNRATIADGTYPLVTFVYLAHRANLRTDSAAAKLRDWLRTPNGQAVVAESGYVPLPRR